MYFSRAKSDLHEAQLNMKLLSALGINDQYALSVLGGLFGLRCEKDLPITLRDKLSDHLFNLIIHPFTNGNTREWPITSFIALIQSLPTDRIRVFITGSAKERDKIEKEIMPHCANAVNVAGLCDLNDFMKLICACDGLIANSTGPLHVAAALGVHALGLFPATKGMDVNRWAPLGKNAEVLIANPHCQNKACVEKNDCVCMASIAFEQVKMVVLKWL